MKDKYCRAALDAALRYARKQDIYYECEHGTENESGYSSCECYTLDDGDTDKIIEALTQLPAITEERDRLRDAAKKVATEYDRLFYKHYMVEEMTELKAALTPQESDNE